MIQTFADLMDHVVAYAGDDSTRAASLKTKTAVQAAYKLLPTHHTWSYLWALGRVVTNGSHATNDDGSTVAYTAATRTVTLTGFTWPSWTTYGFLVVNNTPYSIESVTDSTHLVLTAATAPPADIAAGTSYRLSRDQYPLPADFLSLDEVSLNEVGIVLTYTHPRDWANQRRVQVGPGQPLSFCLLGDPTAPLGRSRMAIWPPPDAVYNIDFPYRRLPRPLAFDRVTGGTVSCTAASQTVTGVGTPFKAVHVGSVLRLAADATDDPTGDSGLNPAVFEATVTAVASATSLTVDTPAVDTLTAVKYVLSDPVDIDRSVMGELLLREVERQWRIPARSGEPKQQALEAEAYARALTVAREADVRFTGRQAALRRQTRRSGFMHYPVQFTGG